MSTRSGTGPAFRSTSLRWSRPGAHESAGPRCATVVTRVPAGARSSVDAVEPSSGPAPVADDDCWRVRADVARREVARRSTGQTPATACATAGRGRDRDESPHAALGGTRSRHQRRVREAPAGRAPGSDLFARSWQTTAPRSRGRAAAPGGRRRSPPAAATDRRPRGAGAMGRRPHPPSSGLADARRPPRSSARDQGAPLLCRPTEAPQKRGRARSGLRRVGDPGFEPGTSSLSEKRSNRLS